MYNESGNLSIKRKAPADTSRSSTLFCIGFGTPSTKSEFEYFHMVKSNCRSSGQPLLCLINVEHNLQISSPKIIKQKFEVEENFSKD